MMYPQKLHVSWTSGFEILHQCLGHLQIPAFKVEKKRRMRTRVFQNGRPIYLSHTSQLDLQFDILYSSNDVPLKLAVKMNIVKSIALLMICFSYTVFQSFYSFTTSFFTLSPCLTFMSFVLFVFLLCDSLGLTGYSSRHGLATGVH